MLAREIDLTAGTELAVEIHDTEMKRTPRKGKPTKIVIDWSGLEATAEDYSNTRFGCHLYIDEEGDVHQFADLWLDQVGRGGPRVDAGAIWIVLQVGVPPVGNVKRGAFLYRWGGKTHKVLGATTEQLESLAEVVILICMSLGIPLEIPEQKKMLGEVTVAEWKGVLLASHVADTPAPGPGVLEILEESFGELAMDEDGDEDEDEDESDDEFEGRPIAFNFEKFEVDFPDPDAG